MEQSTSEPLLGMGRGLTSKRQYRDVGWAWAYLIYLVILILGGIYGYVNRNLSYIEQIQRDYLENPQNCPAVPNSIVANEKTKADLTAEFQQTQTIVFLVTLVVSVMLGCLLLLFFQWCAVGMVYSALGSMVVGPVVAAIYLVSIDQAPYAVAPVLFALVMALLIFMYSSKLRLCGELFEHAAKAMRALPSLIPVLVLTNLVVLLIPVLALVACAWFSYHNASVVQSPRISYITSGNCFDEAHHGVLCCSMVTDTWVTAYIPALVVGLLWTFFLLSQIKVFITGGAVLAWYFDPELLSEVSPVLLATRHAWSTSFGSLCTSSAILTAVQLVREAIESAQRGSDGTVATILFTLLRCCFECCAQIVELLTHFATIHMAGTGQAFWPSAVDTTNLLRRNLMSTAAVWWIPPTVLFIWTLFLTALWGVALFAYLLNSELYLEGDVATRLLVIVSGVVQTTVTYDVLHFFMTVINNVVDTLYIACALDKDHGAAASPAMHATFAQLPSAAVVHNPGGDIMVGVPTSHDVEWEASTGAGTAAGSWTPSNVGTPSQYGGPTYAPPVIITQPEQGGQQGPGGRYYYG